MSLRFEDQTRETLALQFAKFSENECRQSASPFYEALSRDIAKDGDLLELARSVRKGQRAPNLFLAALQYLAFTTGDNPLAPIYAQASRGVAYDGDVFNCIKAFAMDHREQIIDIISTRTVQTNEVGRCAVFLPALFFAHRKMNFGEFHFIDVGCSLGLNLLWDRYRYRYSNGISCGDPSSEVQIRCDIVGDVDPPLGEALPRMSSRVGIEIEPIDPSNPDTVAWVRALIWPDQYERKDLFDRAIAVLGKYPPRIIAGDCTEKIPEVLEQMPDSRPVCLLFSHSINQVFREGRGGLSPFLGRLSGSRALFEISLGNFEGPFPEMYICEYRRGTKVSEELLAAGHPHGKWIAWKLRG